jgi:hypothetical protein
VDEVVAADGQRIPITHDGNDFHIRTGNLQAGGEGQGSAMRGMQGIEVQVDRHARRAADAGHQGHLIVIQTQVVNRPDERTHDNTKSAAGTPDGGEFLVLAQLLQGFTALEPVLRGQLAFIRFKPVGFQ